MAQTVFLTIIIFIVGFILLKQLYQIKKLLKRKEMKDICDYLNNGKISIRDKSCKKHNFNAHIVTYLDSDEDHIIIYLN